MGLRIIFAGTPQFARTLLEGLLNKGHEVVAVLTQPDKPQGRGRQYQPTPVKSLALSQHIPVYQPRALQDDDHWDQLRTLRADVMVVAAYGMLLPQSWLTLCPWGAINVHASLLPRWRGAAPIQRCLWAGDDSTGVSIMQMEEQLDAGDVWYQLACPVISEDTYETLSDRLSHLGLQALLFVLEHRATLKPKSQDIHKVIYAHKIVKEDKWIDWKQSAEVLERQVRALSMWPVATTLWEGEPLKIYEACPVPSVSASCRQDVPVGTVVVKQVDGLDVMTGCGILRIRKLQRPGRRIQQVADFWNACHHRITLMKTCWG